VTSMGLRLRLLLIGSAITAIVAVLLALIVVVERAPTRREGEPKPAAVALRAAPTEPIAAEAQAFQLRGGSTAIDLAARRERAAHPRTLRTFRFLRAYPGAPPRIPHQLTPEEFRTGACKTCHEVGGYSRRFTAYVPLTPHPEMGPCLQCHAVDDAITGLGLRSSDPNARCRRCHGAGGPPRVAPDTTLEWRTVAWPQLAPRRPDRLPPPIPHDLQLRGNCLACHSGPAAVAEIRTPHPGWADCRQCHVALETEAIFTRPAPGAVDQTGAVP
jgi:nitrate reductase (cytochrome), electron transfer subunit